MRNYKIIVYTYYVDGQRTIWLCQFSLSLLMFIYVYMSPFFALDNTLLEIHKLQIHVKKDKDERNCWRITLTISHIDNDDDDDKGCCSSSCRASCNNNNLLANCNIAWSFTFIVAFIRKRIWHYVPYITDTDDD